MYCISDFKYPRPALKLILSQTIGLCLSEAVAFSFSFFAFFFFHIRPSRNVIPEFSIHLLTAKGILWWVKHQPEFRSYSVFHLWEILKFLKSLPPSTNSSIDSLAECCNLTVSLLLISRLMSMCLLTGQTELLTGLIQLTNHVVWCTAQDINTSKQ